MRFSITYGDARHEGGVTSLSDLDIWADGDGNMVFASFAVGEVRGFQLFDAFDLQGKDIHGPDFDVLPVIEGTIGPDGAVGRERIAVEFAHPVETDAEIAADLLEELSEDGHADTAVATAYEVNTAVAINGTEVKWEMVEGYYVLLIYGQTTQVAEPGGNSSPDTEFTLLWEANLVVY